MDELQATIGKRELAILKDDIHFEIAPCDNVIDLADKTRFSKLKLTPAQKSQISAMMQCLPQATATNTLAHAYICRFPDGMPHALTALKQGGFGSMVQGENGQFIMHASFFPTSTQAVLTGAMSAMALASGQYFLAQINDEMSKLNSKLDKILEFLYGDKKAELLAEISFAKYAYRNYGSIMASDSQRVATINSLQDAKKVAIKDIEFYMDDLESTVNWEAKNYSDLDSHAHKAYQIKDSLDLSIQLYIMSNLLEMYYSQNYDGGYIDYIERDITIYIDKCNRRILKSFSVLNRRMHDYKSKPLEKFDKTHHEEKMEELTAALENGEESPLIKTTRAILHSVNDKAEFYLDKGGNMYAKN